MSIKSISIATFALAATIAAGTSTASAHSKHFSFGGGYHHHHGLNIVIGGGGYGGGGCGYYREMWEDTGLFKWKRRYYECKGWW